MNLPNGDSGIGSAARNLLRLRDKMCANPSAQNAQPAFLTVVVGRGNLACTRDDGVHVIPAALLGA